MGSATAGRPRGGVDYPRTYQEFRDWFPNDAACLEYLGQLRWPDGFVCPRCGAVATDPHPLAELINGPTR